jgi:hypothetical protein
MPTAAIIGATNGLWVIIVGSILLALTYSFVSKHKLLYTDILNKRQTERGNGKNKSLILIAVAASVVCCFLLCSVFSLSPLMLFPLVSLTLILTAWVCS